MIHFIKGISTQLCCLKIFLNERKIKLNIEITITRGLFISYRQYFFTFNMQVLTKHKVFCQLTIPENISIVKSIDRTEFQPRSFY
jgi:hypothetical protein